MPNKNSIFRFDDLDPWIGKENKDSPTCGLMSSHDFEFKEKANGRLRLKGFLSTNEIDSYDEIVEPSAFDGGLERFAKNPAMFFNHQWYEPPVGAWDVWDIIKERGLWTEGDLSKSVDPVIETLIREKILKGLSIGFDMKESSFDEETGIRTITKLDLIEGSIVTIPANPGTLISEAKTLMKRYTNIAFDINKKTTKTKEAEMPDEILERMNALEIKFNNAPEPDQVVSEVRQELTLIKSQMLTPDQVQARIKETVDKATDDIMKAQADKLEQFVPTRQVQFQLDDYTMSQVKTPAQVNAFMFNRNPERIVDDIKPLGLSKGFLDDLHRAKDDLVVLHNVMKTSNSDYRVIAENDPKGCIMSLKPWAEFKTMIDMITKAFDTQTTNEGLEFINTEWSSTMVQLLELERNVARFFTRFNMPTKSFTWPLEGDNVTVYLKEEAITDNPSTYTADTPGSANVTFTASGFAGRLLYSDDVDEDSIIAVLPYMQMKLRKALIDAEEDALINGDDSTTHQDSDVTAATDHRKIFDGLRFLANAGAKYDSTETTVGDASFLAGDILRTFKLGGKYSASPKDNILIPSLAAYFNMLEFTEVKTVDLWGQQATYMQGALAAFMGRPIVFSDKVRENLNDTGVYDGSTTDKTIVLNVNTSMECFLIGDRRGVTIETAKDIETGQFKVVATTRWDFQKMAPSADNPVQFAYKITS